MWSRLGALTHEASKGEQQRGGDAQRGQLEVHVRHHQADGVAQVGRTHRQEHAECHEGPKLGGNRLEADQDVQQCAAAGDDRDLERQADKELGAEKEGRQAVETAGHLVAQQATLLVPAEQCTCCRRERHTARQQAKVQVSKA